MAPLNPARSSEAKRIGQTSLHPAPIASKELNNSRPARQVRRLEFNQAMDDFKTMFPNMDYDIIECVLRANSGAVDATIDQLLQMNLEAGGGSVYEDSSDSEDSIPSEILERTLEPDSSDEEPPPVYSPPAYHMHMFDRPYPLAPPTPPPRIDVLVTAPPSGQRRYRNWNPPLLGNLPEDFLRILPQQLDSIQESRWKQYLEDERIALFLQNEEFMKELQRNRDFLLALERDRLKYESQKSTSSSVAVGNDFDFPSPVPGTSDTNATVSEDALFRDKLKHMGKSWSRGRAGSAILCFFLAPPSRGGRGGCTALLISVRNMSQAAATLIQGLRLSLTFVLYPPLRTRDLIRAGVLKEKPLWFDVYNAFPPLREPVFRRPRLRYGKAKASIQDILYHEDRIRAKFYSTYGSGQKAFDLFNPNFKSTCQRLGAGPQKEGRAGVPTYSMSFGFSFKDLPLEHSGGPQQAPSLQSHCRGLRSWADEALSPQLGAPPLLPLTLEFSPQGISSQPTTGLSTSLLGYATNAIIFLKLKSSLNL
ncbi:hypothetical protein CB1_000552019 [Camelus ferus]|nr:hypothetical protein CB1_000552019 [Camelus ferus]